MDFAEAVDWLYGTQLHGIKLGLENTRRLLESLEVDLAKLRFLHVAGTNGKGSTCAMLDSICRAAGYRTGLFTSPHLITFRERVQVQGVMISEGEVAQRISELRKIVQSWNAPPTFFELTTALALAYFQEQTVDVIILETGMGGRLDATNIVTPLVSIITPIDLDHQQWLGATIAEIAREKAGIIKPNVPVVSSPQREEARWVLEEVATKQDAPLRFVTAPLSDFPIHLPGEHQRWNAALAVAALESAALPAAPEAIRDGLAKVHWPGRFQRISERIVLDGAHNPAAARQLAANWREAFGSEDATLILGVLRDKEMGAVCEALMPIARRIITVPVKSTRTSTADELCAAAEAIIPEFPCSAACDLASALERAENFSEPILIAGSLFLVGEALALLEPSSEFSERSAQ